MTSSPLERGVKGSILGMVVRTQSCHGAILLS